MSEPAKQQMGDGRDNFGQAAGKAAQAAKQASKEVAKQAAAKGAEATANAAASTTWICTPCVGKQRRSTARSDTAPSFFRERSRTLKIILPPQISSYRPPARRWRRWLASRFRWPSFLGLRCWQTHCLRWPRPVKPCSTPASHSCRPASVDPSGSANLLRTQSCRVQRAQCLA